METLYTIEWFDAEAKRWRVQAADIDSDEIKKEWDNMSEEVSGEWRLGKYILQKTDFLKWE